MRLPATDLPCLRLTCDLVVKGTGAGCSKWPEWKMPHRVHTRGNIGCLRNSAGTKHCDIHTLLFPNTHFHVLLEVLSAHVPEWGMTNSWQLEPSTEMSTAPLWPAGLPGQ